MTDLLSVYVDLLFWIFQATEIVGMIAYGEGCWIMICEEDLALDQGPGLITQEPLCGRVLLKCGKGLEKASDIDITGGGSVPPH